MVVYRSLCNARRMDARDTVSAHSWECDVCTLNCTLSETVFTSIANGFSEVNSCAAILQASWKGEGLKVCGYRHWL